LNTELITLLLKAGIIKESEAQRALTYESGSSLVERVLSLGYGSEIDVLKIVQNKLKLAVVTSESFQNIPKKVIDFIPRDIVEKHHILPFFMDNTTIHIAFFDPTQDPCLNELCFFTSLKVVPYGALASDITKALNRYYGLTLPEVFRHGKESVDPRYKGTPIKPLGKDFTRDDNKLPPLPNSRPTTIPKKEQSSTFNFPPPSPGERVVSEKKDKEVDELKDKLKEMQESFNRLSKQVSAQSKPNVEVKRIQEVKENINIIQEEDITEIKDEELVADIDYEDDIPEFQDVSGVFTNPSKQMKTDDVFVHSIEQGIDKDAVLEAVVREIKKIASRSVILFVRYDDLLPISGIGEGIEDSLSGLRISLKESSVFRSVYNTKKEFSGTIPSTDMVLDSFIRHFAGNKPRSIVVVPSMIDDEIFSMIYAEETKAVDDLKKISKAMAKAFDRLLNS